MENLNEINVKSLRREIEETVDPEAQQRLKQLTLPSVRAGVKLLESELNNCVKQFRREFHLRTLKETTSDPYTISVERIWSQIAYGSAFAAMIQDSLVSGSLAQSWLNIAPTKAVIIGALIGIVLSVGWKFGVGTVSRAFNSDAPRSARRKLEAITSATFVVNVILICIVLLSRNPTESLVQYLVTVTGFSTTLMGITLPILAGALLALGQDLDWSHGYQVTAHRTTMRLAELQGLLAWADGAEPNEASPAGAEAEAKVI